MGEREINRQKWKWKKAGDQNGDSENGVICHCDLMAGGCCPCVINNTTSHLEKSAVVKAWLFHFQYINDIYILSTYLHAFWFKKRAWF
jgi:hypothetical protein